MNPETGNWHLDKKVPISIIVVLLVYLAGGLWFLSKLESKVTAVEVAQTAILTSRVVMLDTQRRIDDRQDRDQVAADRSTTESLREMNGKLDRLIERGRR